MKRRDYLTTTAIATTAVLSGCTSTLNTITGNNKNCSDEGTPITELTENSGNRVTISGHVTTINNQDSTFIVDDGTARALIGAPPYPEKGDCVTIEGNVSGCIGSSCPEDLYYLDPARITNSTS